MAVNDPVTLSVTTLAVSSGVSAFYQMLPPISEVRKQSAADPTFRADVRIGEVAGTVVALGIGAISSSLSGSPVPIVGAAVLSLVMIALYESTLRTDHALEV